MTRSSLEVATLLPGRARGHPLGGGSGHLVSASACAGTLRGRVEAVLTGAPHPSREDTAVPDVTVSQCSTTTFRGPVPRFRRHRRPPCRGDSQRLPRAAT